MIAKDLVIDVSIATPSMRQIYTLTHIDAVAPIKLILSSPSAGDLNDWRCNRKLGRGARCCKRPMDYSTPNYSRILEIDAKSALIGLANVKFRNSWERELNKTL